MTPPPTSRAPDPPRVQEPESIAPASPQVVVVQLPASPAQPVEPVRETVYVYIPPEHRVKKAPESGKLGPNVSPKSTRPAEQPAAKIIRSEDPKNNLDNNSPNNSANNSEPELLEPAQPAPKATVAPYKKKGTVGRKRRYEELGKNEEEPVKVVVLYRYHTGRHWPGMSKDMQDWYDRYYFTRPNKAKDGNEYERHVKAYERRRKWIAEERGEAVAPLGRSRKVVPYRRRAHG